MESKIKIKKEQIEDYAVQKTGDETIDGRKNFIISPRVPHTTDPSTAVNLEQTRGEITTKIDEITLQKVLDNGNIATNVAFSVQSANDENCKGKIALENSGIVLSGQAGGIVLHGDTDGVTINSGSGPFIVNSLGTSIETNGASGEDISALTINSHGIKVFFDRNDEGRIDIENESETTIRINNKNVVTEINGLQANDAGEITILSNSSQTLQQTMDNGAETNMCIVTTSPNNVLVKESGNMYIGSGSLDLYNADVRSEIQMSSTGYTDTDTQASGFVLRATTEDKNFGLDVTVIEGTTPQAIVSGSSDFAGFVYADDYSTNFTDRSLVDKAYVDSVAGVDEERFIQKSTTYTPIHNLISLTQIEYDAIEEKDATTLYFIQ